ncbi:MAG: OmpA family protein, partial [Phycisphaerales bacterium]|nr:OmpA family protein [Phycisphaerales bacterium]
LEEVLAREMTATISGLVHVRFDAEEGDKARLVLAGTVLAREVADRYSASVALTDRNSGLVIAQSVARFREAGLDRTPTEFYRDSPSLVRDRSVEAYVKTSTTPAGQLADPLYVQQLPTAAVLAAALEAYNKGEWETALALYSAAGSRPDGHQLRTLNGIYLGNIRLGRLAAAEEAFGRIAAYGLETNNLAVKLLFRPGTTEFWPGQELGRMYPMWLRQIARAAHAAKRCVNVVGHTSRTGPEAFNDTLSLNRAESVKRIMEAEVPGLARQLRATGVGFRENIIGSGADDASDAVDRRVEFRVVSCAAGSS